VEGRSAEGHAEAADLDEHVGPLGQPTHPLAPDREGFGGVRAVAAYSQEPADMVGDDRRIGKSGGEIHKFAELGMVYPGVERQAERREPGKALAEPAIHEQSRLRTARPAPEYRISIPVGGLADTAKPALSRIDMGFQYRCDGIAEAQVGMADDAGAQAGSVPGGGQEEPCLADRAQAFGAVREIVGVAFDRHGLHDPMSRAEIGQQIGSMVVPAAPGTERGDAIPQMVVRIDDRQVGFDRRVVFPAVGRHGHDVLPSRTMARCHPSAKPERGAARRRPSVSNRAATRRPAGRWARSASGSPLLRS